MCQNWSEIIFPSLQVRLHCCCVCTCILTAHHGDIVTHHYTWSSNAANRVIFSPILFRKCRDKAFNNQTDTCDVNFEIRPISEVEVYPERCGTEPFDPVDHECCNGELIGPGFTCCGRPVRAWDTPGTNLGEGKCCDSSDGSSKGYNNQTRICCQGVVHVKSGQGKDKEIPFFSKQRLLDYN